VKGAGCVLAGIDALGAGCGVPPSGHPAQGHGCPQHECQQQSVPLHLPTPCGQLVANKVGTAAHTYTHCCCGRGLRCPCNVMCAARLVLGSLVQSRGGAQQQVLSGGFGWEVGRASRRAGAVHRTNLSQLESPLPFCGCCHASQRASVTNPRDGDHPQGTLACATTALFCLLWRYAHNRAWTVCTTAEQTSCPGCASGGCLHVYRSPSA
jgi:hypothetical protein